MARIVLSGLLQDIRGSIGGSTFSSWKNINYLKNKAIAVTNPQTPAQMMVRQNLALSVSEWRNLTDSQKAQWEEYAQSLKLPNSMDEVVGDSGIIPTVGRVQSGINTYVGVNQFLKGAGLPRVSVPPVPPDVYPPELFGFVTTGWGIEFHFYATLNPEAKARKLEVWIKGDWKGSHAYIERVVDVPVPPAVPPVQLITKIRKGSGNNIQEVLFSAIGVCSVYLQGIIVRNDGNRSVSTALYRLTVTA